MRAAALLGGIDVTVQMTDFDNYSQQILDSSSAMYAFNPDAVIFAVQTRDIARDLWDDYTDQAAERLQARVEEWVGAMREWVRHDGTGSFVATVRRALDLVDAQARLDSLTSPHLETH